MPTVTALQIGNTLVVPYEEDPFISLEDVPIVLGEIRSGLPQLKEALMSRWPIINAVELENRRITRRRNPYDPAKAFADAVFGIAIYVYSRPARIFLDEVARGAAKKVGPALGDQIVEIIEYVRIWIKGKAHTLPTRKDMKHLAQQGGLRTAAKKVRRRRSTNAEKRR